MYGCMYSSEVSSKTVSINFTSVYANQMLEAENVHVVGSIPVRYPTTCNCVYCVWTGAMRRVDICCGQMLYFYKFLQFN